MAPQQHLQWFEHNIGWFESLEIADLQESVPNCPGWTVEDVLNHLSYGLGRGYQVALTQPAGVADEQVFDGVERPTTYPIGEAAMAAFTTNMRSCLETFRKTDPERVAWTYEGQGRARFWFRRAAIETALHRLDVQDALPRPRDQIPPERLADGIAETVEFALPLAARIAGEPQGGLTVAVADLNLRLGVGNQSPLATISGSGEDVLVALWGRRCDRVQVVGDGNLAADWLSLVEQAFSGR